MNNGHCDFSPMKQTLKEEIRQVISALQDNLEAMGDENYCLLGNFEKIKDKFIYIDMKAATFYLNCYLSPFTDKYPELSTCVQNLSNLRHGGLIVIQRGDPLDSLIQPGISIGAELTHSLLESIFFLEIHCMMVPFWLVKIRLFPQQMSFRFQTGQPGKETGNTPPLCFGFI